MKLVTPEIYAVCRSHYGRYVGGGRWSPPNRCDSCPLLEPCLAWSRASGHTLDELVEAHSTFIAESERILAAAPGGQP